MDAESVTRLRRVVARLTRELNASATDEGLTPTQASVLGLIVGRGPIGLAELIALERINPTMLSRVIGKLDELGLLRRLTDADDQRAVRVQATPAGVAVQDRIRTRRIAAVSDCLDRLPARQNRSIAAALPALEALVAELEHGA